MSKADQRQVVRRQREKVVKELISTYMSALDQLSNLDLSDRTIAKLAQLIIRSREAALQIMEEEIEAPLRTCAVYSPILDKKVEK